MNKYRSFIKKLILFAFIMAIFGCENFKYEEKEITIESFVFGEKSDWDIASDFLFGKTSIIYADEKNTLCFYDKSDEKHLCIFYFQKNNDNFCETSKYNIERIIKLPVILTNAYSTCDIDGKIVTDYSMENKYKILLKFETKTSVILKYQKRNSGFVCRDETISYSSGRGTCSWHGGISGNAYYWHLMNHNEHPFLLKPYF